jgi:hypothetical protein
MHATCHASLILLELITQSYGTPHYAVFSNLLSLRLFSVQCSSQHPILKHQQYMLVPRCQRPSFSPMEIQLQFRKC